MDSEHRRKHDWWDDALRTVLGISALGGATWLLTSIFGDSGLGLIAAAVLLTVFAIIVIIPRISR